MYNKKVFISVVALALLFILGISLFVYKNSSTNSGNNTSDVSDIAEAPVNPQKGDVGYEEKNTVIKSDSGSKLGGSLVSVEESTISVNNSGNVVSYSLNEVEIAVQCTSQKLLGATSVDVDLVDEVKIVAPGRLRQIEIGEPVFLVGSENAGAFNIHTVFVASDVCKGL